MFKSTGRQCPHEVQVKQTTAECGVKFKCPICGEILYITPENGELNNRTNELRESLELLPSLVPLRIRCHQKLDEWKDNIIESIYEIHRSKFNEINSIYEELAEEIIKFKAKSVRELDMPMRDCKPENFENIQDEINRFKNKTLMDVVYEKIPIYDKLKITTIKSKQKENQFDLTCLKPIKTIPLRTTSTCLVSSGLYLLIKQTEQVCVIFDQNDNKIHEFNTTDIIYDLCWSSYMNMFLVLCKSLLLTCDPNRTFQLNIVREMNASTKCRENDPWSISVHNSDAYVVYSSGIIHRFKISNWEIIDQWSSNEILKKTDYAVCSIRNNGTYCGLLILQKDLHWRIDLFDFDMVQQRYGLPIDQAPDECSLWVNLTVLHNDEWLFCNKYSNKVYLIDSEGKIKQIGKNCTGACLMNDQCVGIVTTEPQLEIIKL
ncbi:unnamed protein product [Didymodactylos carnosus]|uniref:Uncharacterized protein n=1 Tax=Didymodactylos carnosus TaxID=1234261 RepID=A0A813Y760_9BILA|nr:unnamed protein product [Didymodactylos carnosus]CAF0905046.1 unnamed protein product [Didymodactylos carnosus]CAF3666382.1 unnamed protein product [Didymodactylos carnosus]CAF3685075.1 unnamed protein product [Didymodactylos carnosus]